MAVAPLAESTQQEVRKTGIGEPVRRVEDARFLSGQGRYVDDVVLPRATHAYVLRSPHAHARIVRIDTTKASAAPGVLAVLTGENVLREGLGGLPCGFFPSAPAGRAWFRPTHPILAIQKVRHVGDRVALVVAETLAQAKDAAELVEVDYAPLPPIMSLEKVLDVGAPKVWDEAGGNLCFEMEWGDRQAVDRAFASAAHVSKLFIHQPRTCANTMEPRAALAMFDQFDNRYTLYCTSQSPFRQRDVISSLVLKIPETNLRVIAPDVGGSFGLKGTIYPEDALVVWAAGKLNRPVKWTADRSESLMSDMHGRDQLSRAELALAEDGRILALRASTTVNLGAYLGYSAGSPASGVGTNLSSVYDVPLIHSVVRAAFTNTNSIGAYRGTGKPEATFIIERLLDKASREMAIDPVAIRRRNLIRPSSMPYKTQGGYHLDCGEFERVFDKTLALADWAGFAPRRAASERRGRRRGIGIGMHCNPSGGFQSERMEIRVDASGSIALHVGTRSTGQGHETMYAQMISEWLMVPLDRIRTIQGDTDQVLFGRGTFAERSMLVGGAALRGAADVVIARGKRLAACMLESEDSAIEFENGMFRVPGSNRAASLTDVARRSYAGSGVPVELGVGLDGVGTYTPTHSFPNGCMIGEVEVDPETGAIHVERISIVIDVGAIINPLGLGSQLHGSIAHGFGHAVLEEVVTDPLTGQLLSGSFMDYCMPRADDLPSFAYDWSLVKTKTNPLGVKGGSEAGNMTTPPAIMNAVIDAIAPLGVTDLPMPATRERVWRAIRAADTSSARFSP